jgi:diadenosine tetraphosphate (Ap4A) HIT family hydrolase
MTDIKYTGNDFYCDIAILKKVDLNIVFENENILAFYHTKPYYEIHIVVVPKKHINSFTTLDLESDFAKEYFKKIQEIKHMHFHVASGAIINKKVN